MVANYNHMHALTVQYYEVVQVYRVLVDVHSVQRVVFLPFQLLDFSTDSAGDIVARFRGQLLAASLSERVASLLLDDRGVIEIRSAIRVQLPPIFSDVVLAGTAVNLARASTGSASEPPSPTTPTTPPTTPGGGVLTAPGPATTGLIRRITSPGPVLDTVVGDVELVAVSFDGVRVDRVRLDQAGVPADNTTFAVPSTTFQVDFPGGMPLRNVTAIHVSKIDADADSGTMTLHYRTATRQLSLPVPLDLPAGTAMQKVAFLAADPSNRKDELMAHLQANRAYYSQAVLANIDTATLVMLLSRFTWNGKPLVDQVEPKPLAMTGNYLVLRAPVEEGEASGIDGITWGKLLSDRSLNLAQRDDRLVPIPTGGVFAEAVLGRSNSAEKLDITRFWNWQDSPIPLQPPEIAPVSTGSRGATEDLRPGQLGAPVLNVLNPTPLPEPAGLTAAMTALANGSMFRDMSGLAGTQALAQAASAGTLDAATEAGRLASTNLKTVTDQAVAMGQTAADMWKTAQANKGAGGAAGGGTGSSISADGARINHGRDMDQRGVTDAARAPSSGSGFRVTEQQSEFQAAGSAGDSGGSGNAASSEFVFAETAATGVSPSQIAATTNALGGGVANAAAFSALSSSLVSSLSVTTLLDNLLLTVVRIDTEASVAPMQAINLRTMLEHKHGKAFEAADLGAWTNNTTDVHYSLKGHLAAIQIGRQQRGLSEDKALLFARGVAVAVIRHELVHIKQFKDRNGKPPQTFTEMVDLEIKAYGCDAATADPNSTQNWLDDTNPNGAIDFLTTKLKLDKTMANHVMDFVQDGLDDRCATLMPLRNKSPAEVKAVLVKEKLLPEKVNNNSNYKIDELYQ